MKTPNHPCSVPGCGVMLLPHILMCRTHWRRVPHNLRAAVWNAWEAYQCGEATITELREVQERATVAVMNAMTAKSKGGA